MQEVLLKIAATINTYLSDYILIFLLVGVGLYYSIRTRFVQVRCFGEGMKKVFGNLKLRGEKQSSGMSSFQALATAIAAQVGTGNIVGASGAILTGGPGAIFWMWIIAFLGMATIYAEAVLAQETKVKDADGYNICLYSYGKSVPFRMVSVKGGSNLKTTITGLKSKEKFYIDVQAYRISLSGTTVSGAFSDRYVFKTK